MELEELDGLEPQRLASREEKLGLARQWVEVPCTGISKHALESSSSIEAGPTRSLYGLVADPLDGFHRVGLQREDSTGELERRREVVVVR